MKYSSRQIASCCYFFITEMSKENDLQVQWDVSLKECNAMYSCKLESIRSFSIGKRRIFLKINNRKRWGEDGVGGGEKE